MPENRPTDRNGAPNRTGTGQIKEAPKLRFEAVPPTRRQAEQMDAGLGILAEWLIRRHKGVARSAGGNTSDGGQKTPKKNLDFHAPPSPHVT